MSEWPRVDQILDIIPRYALVMFTGFLGEYNTDYLMDQTETTLVLLNLNLISWGIMVASAGGFLINTIRNYLKGRPKKEEKITISEPIQLN